MQTEQRDLLLATLVELFPYKSTSTLLHLLKTNDYDVDRVVEGLLNQQEEAATPPALATSIQRAPAMGAWWSKLSTQPTLSEEFLRKTINELHTSPASVAIQKTPCSTQHRAAAATVPRKILRDAKPIQNIVDLHGFRCKEAVELVQELTEQLMMELQKRGGMATAELDLIVGLGNHSPNRKPRLRGAIISYLDEKGIYWREPRAGVISVHLAC
eukprot:TRINITY_DN8988_c0_g1_i1.p1 TRINITY_DN8988_c0_g1~~TRINITY_DN8988_c0_g1_i1.p1  ORF type:complete len:214 (-),score=41.25 TRINITY_DN8988_c0_g1_i1:85-726(-)